VDNALQKNHCGQKEDRNALFASFPSLFTILSQKDVSVVLQKNHLSTSHLKPATNVLAQPQCGTQLFHFVKLALLTSLLGTPQLNNAKNARFKSLFGIPQHLHARPVHNLYLSGIKQQTHASNARHLHPHGM
jgi:hypothetical protein